MADTYGFPILTAEECVAFFREVYNTAISEEDFKNPEVRRWQVFYGMISELMTGRQADFIGQTLQTHLHALTDCEYSDLHEESFAFMNFTMALQQMMSAAGIVDFTVKDLLEPRPKRLLRIVSGAVNFIRFRGCQEEVFNKKKEGLERKRESYDFVLKENAELKKTLRAKKDSHMSHMMKMNQLQEENNAISARIQEQHKQRDVLQRNLSEIKNESSQRNATVDQLKVNILSAQAEGEKLSQRIVQSPERVKTEQECAKNRIMVLRSTVEEKFRRSAEVQRQKEAKGTQQQNVDKALNLLRDVSNESERLGELEKEITRRQDKHQGLRSTQLSMLPTVDSLRQQQATHRDKLAKLDLQYYNKKASMQEHISQLSQLKKTLHDPRGSSEIKISELMKEKEHIGEEVERKGKGHEAKLKQVNKVYFEILQQVDKLNTEVGNGFNQFRTVMKSCTSADELDE